MLKLVKRNDDNVLEQIKAGKLDAVKISTTNLVDDIIMTMHEHGILNATFDEFEDKRHHNTTIPFNLVMALSVAAKMKVHTSLTDIPYALTDHRVISALGYNLISEGQSFMREGSIRALVGKYTADELFCEYRSIVQNRLPKAVDIEGTIHMLDCTKLTVNLSNENYEESAVTRFEGETLRGYKLATIRSIVGDTGIIRDIRFAPINANDLTMSQEMMLTTPIFKPGDVLINDRGFMSRTIMNQLKTDRGVDTYIPLKKSMEAFEAAVGWAKDNGVWNDHPDKKRKNQKVSPVIELGVFWHSDNVEKDVPIYGCVIFDEAYNDYHVFVTTDERATSDSILKVYAMRWEVEEDYRQLKDFWKLEDFKSTKLNVIAFHIMSVLIGYLFFQLYVMLPEGEQLSGRSLPVVLKNFHSDIVDHHYVVYVGDEFAICTMGQLMQLCISAPPEVQKQLIQLLG